MLAYKQEVLSSSPTLCKMAVVVLAVIPELGRQRQKVQYPKIVLTYIPNFLGERMWMVLREVSWVSPSTPVSEWLRRLARDGAR